MKKQYESTIEESVRAHFRLAEVTGIVARQRLYGLIGVALGAAVAAAIFPMGMFERLLMFILVLGIMTPVHLLIYKSQLKKNLRKTLVKALGTDQPVPTEIEVDDRGYAHRKMGQEIRFSWDGVVEVSAEDDAIVLITEPAGVAIIPLRIFSSPEERDLWWVFIDASRKGGNRTGTPPPLPAPDPP